MPYPHQQERAGELTTTLTALDWKVARGDRGLVYYSPDLPCWVEAILNEDLATVLDCILYVRLGGKEAAINEFKTLDEAVDFVERWYQGWSPRGWDTERSDAAVPDAALLGVDEVLEGVEGVAGQGRRYFSLLLSLPCLTMGGGPSPGAALHRAVRLGFRQRAGRKKEGE
jgi:hypothetical protein